MKKKIIAVNPDLTDGQVKVMVSRWFVESQGTVNVSIHSTHLYIRRTLSILPSNTLFENDQ